jgi:hypothetical protein
LYYDTQILLEKLVTYIEAKNPNIKINDLYEKEFTEEFKALVKNEEEFLKFLNDINFSLTEFIEISVHVVPHCFTSNLVKFIKKQYVKKGIK